MIETKEVENKSPKRLSIITDIILLIPIIFATIIVIKAFQIPTLDDEATEVLSLETQNQTVSQENEYYIKKIKNEFGINVAFGKNVENFAKRVDATAQYDENIINNNIKIIYKALEKYPIEVFDMSLSKENPVYIMMVDKFENNNLALASRNNLDEYRIYISNTEKLERAFHHEMYHVLEYYMSKSGKKLYNEWANLNPKDFKYNEDTSKLTKDYVYDKENEDVTNCYFLTKYSKTTEKEDRAEIFAEIMTLKNAPVYLKSDCNIRKKADSIRNTLNNEITYSDFYFSKYMK